MNQILTDKELQILRRDYSDDAYNLIRETEQAVLAKLAAQAAPKEPTESNDLTIAYMAGFSAGKKAAPTKEPQRPINCGTGYCSCIECVMEPNAKLVEALEQIASFDKYEPAGPAAYTAQAALNLYKNSRNLDTSQERVHETAKSEQMPLTAKEISMWWASENGLEDCEMSRIEDFLQVVRAVEQRHGIGGKV